MDNIRKTTVFISYNQVSNFCSGWHAKNKVFICANDNGYGRDTGQGVDDYAKAGSVMHQLTGQYYNGAVPVDKVDHYYIYAGLHAMEQAIDIARSLQSKNQAPVTVVVCSCRIQEKKDLLRDVDIVIKQCECGGVETMGQLVKTAIA